MSRNKIPAAIANATRDDLHDAYVNDGNLKASEEELDDRADTDTSSTPTRTVACSHEFVNIGFSSRKMVCKHCDLEE